MHQSTQKSFRDALEMHQKSAESDVQGCTLTRGFTVCFWLEKHVLATVEPDVTTSSPRDGKALRGWQTWAQPLGWPLSHRCRRDNCPLYEPPTESSLGVQSVLKSLTLIQHSFDIQNPMWKLVGLKLSNSRVLPTFSYL